MAGKGSFLPWVDIFKCVFQAGAWGKGNISRWMCPAWGNNSPPHPQHPPKINYPWAEASLDPGGPAEKHP